VVDTPPSADLVLRDRNGQVFEIHARDVVWFESLREPLRAAQAARATPRDDMPTDTSLRIAGLRRGVRADLDLPGRIYVMAGQSGLEVINEAELESILEGVVASEIFHSAPDAALRAQAVAARTDMLAKVGTRHATDPFAICSEVHCQAYRGLERVSPRIAQAVRDTRGQVLVDPDGRLIDAYYHAVSGGHTEHNELVWPGRPQTALRGHPDLTEGSSPLRGGATEEAVQTLLEGKDQSWAAASGLNGEACRWRVERSAAELLSQLKPFGVQRLVRELRVTQRGVSGRAIGLQVTTEDGQQLQIDGELRIRDALGGSHGPRGLRSSLILIRPGPNNQGVPQSWTFFGAGFGHGVGMDQTGAVARAKAGQDFKTILLHYYAGAALQKLY
jgi:SpoIID/LytB domain protein